MGIWSKRRGGPNAPGARKIPANEVAAVPVGGSRLVRVEKLDGDLVRLSTAHTIDRARSAALATSGSVLIPRRALDAVAAALKRAGKGGR